MSNIDHIPAALAKSISESAEVFEAYKRVRRAKSKLCDANEQVHELSKIAVDAKDVCRFYELGETPCE